MRRYGTVSCLNLASTLSRNHSVTLRQPAPEPYHKLTGRFGIDLAIETKRLPTYRLATSGAPEYGNYVNHWYDEYDVGQKENWSAPNFNDST
jgi:hypothetical protein